MEYQEYKIMYEAEDTHWWYRGMRGVMFRLLHLSHKPVRQPRILDAGCGTGGNLQALKSAGYRNIAGFDLSPIALEFTRKRGLENVRQGSITGIPFEDNGFDIAISCDVVTDAGTDNETVALKELYRVIKPGGRLFLNLPAFNFLRSEHDRATDVARRVTRPEIEAKLAAVGFKVKRATYWNMVLFPVVVAVRFLRRESSEDLQAPARSDIVLPPGPLNLGLTICVWLEHLLLRAISLPLGSSVAVVAVKPRKRPE
ncbi:MAG: class I SAM-dependent methyltransferase [Chloroflexota bacterium]